MHTTLANMLRMLERPLQAKVSRDRQRMVDTANRIRQIFYNLYREFEMEVDVTECFQVQCFNTCHDCPGGYFGVTLPAYMNTVEAAWKNGDPVTLYSKWRESKVGIKPAKDCMLASYDVKGTFPTERDVKPSGSYLVVAAKDPQDNGKSVEIVYVSPSGEEKREALQLTAGEPIATTDIAMSIKSVVLPSPLRGSVTIKERCSGRVLSEYMPYELVPSYRRIKITGVCAQDQVLITANRQYQPVYWDTDIVETDNEDAIANAGLHLFYASSGPDQGMIQKSEYHKNLMKEALKGEASRNIGVNRENDTGRFGPPVRRSRLFRGRGGHNITFRR